MKNLLILIFMSLLAIPASDAKPNMEKEILRELKQIRTIGETSWSSKLAVEKYRSEKESKKKASYGQNLVLMSTN